ncbi:MAG: hypothetical protein M3483_05105, partial [Gemmatimonadota bacterium]|nr:hypothetical protein [Gemmatimonadota bacterium]
PYTVQATMRKVHGRLHEGYGVVLGGDPLDAAENEQRYTYFLVRGDGSYLLKRRSGAETPLIRGWTFHPAIGRDTEEGGETNRLTVRVGAAEVSFQVNGEEVARIPSGEIDVRGIPGLRVAHDIELRVSDFRVTAAAPAIRPPE